MNQGQHYEEIRGVIKGLMPPLGTKLVDIVITNYRVLIIRTGSMISSAIVGGAVGGYMLEKAKGDGIYSVQQLEYLLKSDPKNLSVPFNGLHGIKIKKGFFSSDLWVLLASGKSLHYGGKNAEYDQWFSILENVLPEKLMVV